MDWLSACDTAAIKLADLNCTEERLTATRICVGQRTASAQAWCQNPLPIAMMSPVSSAMGMKSAGDTLPRSGWFQRKRASKAMTSLRLTSMSGW